MQRRTFLTALAATTLLPGFAEAKPLMCGWFWLRWEAHQGEEVDLEYLVVHPPDAKGTIQIPAALRAVPSLNGPARARGPLTPPISWGKGPCIVLNSEQFRGSPTLAWLRQGPEGWAYRVDVGRPWGENQRQMTLACPEFRPSDYQKQGLNLLRSVLKAQQEEKGVFLSHSAGHSLLGKEGTSAILLAPESWTAQHFPLGGPRGLDKRAVAFLEVHFKAH